MKAKREFYLYGNDRKFHDDYIVSIMTGEPMPRKWQQYLELTPEEKARWDDSLRLDAEYRRAEAQGFPNGIPGGRTRGNVLYTLTQMEEEYERDLMKKRMEEALHPYRQFLTPRKTDIHDNVNDTFGNIMPVDNLWQDPFDTWKTADMSVLSRLQTENKPALDPLGMRQAIQRLTESIRASMNHANQEPQTNGRDNTAMAIPANDSPEPPAYDRAQTNDSLIPTGAPLRKKNEPPNVFGDIDVDTQDHAIYSIYAAEEETSPQTYSIYSNLAAMRTPSLSLTTGFSSYRPTSHVVNLSNSRATPLTTDASHTVQGYPNSNTNNNSNRYANHDSAGTSIPAPNNNGEEDSFGSKIVSSIGQYGDGGTVPSIALFDINNPEEIRTLVQDLQKYKSYIQTAADEAYKKLPDIAYEAASLVIPKLPPHIKGTALGALIVLGICLRAKEAYDEWDEKSGKQRLIVLFSDKLMFYFTEEWVENITDTFGIPKKYSRPILFAVKDALSKTND